MARVKQIARPATPEDLDSKDLGNVETSSSELETMKDKLEPSFYFGKSMVTQSLIATCVERCYFMQDIAHAPKGETMPEPKANECMVFRDFFKVGLRLPCHYLIHCNLDCYGVKIHQLTPNAFVLLSKFV